MKKILSLMLLVGLVISGCHQKQDESGAIKKLLEKESATWRAGDIKEHAACWHIQPYSRILVSTADGRTIDVPPGNMTNPSTKMGNGGSSVNTNYKMSINGDNAWVSHDEESTGKDGIKTYSFEIRILEKINDQWKLTGQSIHIYKPR